MKSIIQKYLRGDATEMDEIKLYKWLNEKGEHLDIFKEEVAFYLTEDSEVDQSEVQRAFDNFCKQITNLSPKPVLVRFIQNYLKYAAMITILISGILIFKYMKSSKESSHVEKSGEFQTEDVLKTQITLTQENGTIEVIDSQREGLYYVDTSAVRPNTYNELYVPNGQIFKVVLSDGTIVWLNSNTKLRYPTAFSKEMDTRMVWLEGEAFFDVMPNKNKPFIVSANEVDVKVLGTKFNISSYQADDAIYTTLIEGSVSIQENSAKQNAITIQPNFQATFEKESMHLDSKKVNTGEYTAWIQRKIIFNNTSFEELIPRIERTYNVKILNENLKLNKEQFTGEFDIESIETVFKALSASIPFEYTINKNIITIKK